MNNSFFISCIRSRTVFVHLLQRAPRQCFTNDNILYLYFCYFFACGSYFIIKVKGWMNIKTI